MPQLSDRSMWEPWIAAGGKTMLDRALDLQEKILSEHTLDWLEEDKLRELDKIVAAADQEILGV